MNKITEKDWQLYMEVQAMHEDKENKECIQQMMQQNAKLIELVQAQQKN